MLPVGINILSFRYSMGQSLCNHNQTYGTLSHKCHGRSGQQSLSLLGYCTVEIFYTEVRQEQ